MIGGLAVICFTKAFGIAFLGTQRSELQEDGDIEKPQRILPMYGIGLFIMIIGLFPFLFTPSLLKVITLYLPGLDMQAQWQFGDMLGQLTKVGWYSLGFLAQIMVIYFLKRLLSGNRVVILYETWGCAFSGATPKMQYTASSFIRSYRKLAAPILSIKKEKHEADGLYPHEIMQQTHAHDKIETWLIDKPLLAIRKLLNSFVFLQNGNIQAYILYGFVFVGLALLLPSVIEKLMVLINFLNQI